jgi:uncharacterized protein (DUF433 family)
MTLMIEIQPLPLSVDADSIIRIGDTRVTLDTVIAAFSEGATPEEIAYQYPSLHLSDIYAVIGYYLGQRAEVEAYLAERSTRAVAVQQQNEARFDPQGVRDRLLARRSAKGL